MRTFIRVVGALEGPRAERSRAILASLEDRAAPNTNRDVVPRSVWQSRVKPALSEQGITTRALQSSLGVNYCGSALYKSNLSRDRAARVAEVVRSPELAGLASSDVYWDRIESIEPAGVEPVYDLTVDDIHNFVAGDVIVHNSIEQDADVVGFIFREEYYEKENSERPGEADLIIAKHRNGPIGTVPLAFLEHYPSFANLARQSDVDGQDFGDAADVAEAV